MIPVQNRHLKQPYFTSDQLTEYMFGKNGMIKHEYPVRRINSSVFMHM